MADVEIRVPALPLRKFAEKAWPAIVVRSQIRRRRIVNGMAPGIRSENRRSPRKPLLKARLQRMVNRGAGRRKVGNTRIEHRIAVSGAIALLHRAACAEWRGGI